MSTLPCANGLWLYASHGTGMLYVRREKAGVEGIRVTPNVYTTLDEVDRFIEAMQGMLGRG